MASETAAISFRYFTIESKVRASCPISSCPVNVDVVLQIAGLADLLRHVNQPVERPVIPVAVR
jgi:hypothetical protein